jgi:hypothetical protein
MADAAETWFAEKTIPTAWPSSRGDRAASLRRPTLTVRLKLARKQQPTRQRRPPSVLVMRPILRSAAASSSAALSRHCLRDAVTQRALQSRLRAVLPNSHGPHAASIRPGPTRTGPPSNARLAMDRPGWMAQLRATDRSLNVSARRPFLPD